MMNSGKKFIGLDIGTTSICGVVVNMRTGAVDSVTRSNDSWIPSKRGRERMQDPAKIMRKVRLVLSELLAVHKEVAGIGVTGQMHGIVYTGKDGNAVSPLYTWQDARGGLPYRRGTMSYAEELSKETGYALAPGYGIVTHWYNLKNGLVPKKARSFCTIHDYVVMQLSGGKFPVIDPTDAASLGAFDLKRNVFDRKALANARIGSGLLPEVVPCGTHAGSFRAIPVYSALGDNQASFLGSVRNIDRTLLVNIGTGGQVSAYTKGLVSIDGLDVRPFPGGGYILVGPLLCGGKAYAMLEKFFRRTAGFFSLSSGNTDFYACMNAIDYPALAEKLDIDTRFAGTRQNAALRGVINGISMENFTPEHLVAGFLDGITSELYNFYLMMPGSVRSSITSLVGAGNGLRRNKLLCRIISSRFGHRMQIPVHREEASVGAALTAAVGAGHFSSFQSAGRIFRYE